MASIRIVGSAYTQSSTTYTNVANATYMYDTSSDTTDYASLRGRNRNSSTAYYCFIHGFDFDTVPTEALVSNFVVTIRCYRSSNQRTGTNFYLRLCSSPSNSSVITGTTTSTSIDTTANVITIPTGDLTWNDLVTAGTNFSIEVPLASTSSSYPYVYVYGADIEVTYTMPTTYDITASTTSGSISPSGTTSVIEGHDFTLSLEVENPVVIDNNVNVTSQLIQITGGTDTFIPYSYTSTGYSVSDISNAYTDISSTTRADLSLSSRTTGNIYLNLGPINIPDSATILSVSCQASLGFSRNNSSSSATASCQLYSGNTAKGSSTTVLSSATDLSQTTFTLTPGTWMASELANAKFYLTTYNGASSTVRHMYIYGVSFTVTYSISGDFYTYTITNVTADHTIVVSSSGVSTKIFIKKNGSWVRCSKVYKKVNGSWVEQASSTWTTILPTTDDYRLIEV